MSRQITVAQAREIALAIVESELEVPGPVPPAVLELLTEIGPQRVAQSSVAATKRSIAKRLNETFDLWEK